MLGLRKLLIYKTAAQYERGERSDISPSDVEIIIEMKMSLTRCAVSRKPGVLVD